VGRNVSRGDTNIHLELKENCSKKKKHTREERKRDKELYTKAYPCRVAKKRR
jgi:hypothetical protein